MNQSKKIKELSSEIRPYEKCMMYGPELLTDVELLANIIRCGTKKENVLELCTRILYQNKGGLSSLVQCSLNDLKKISGIGPVKAVQLASVIELSKRIAKCEALPALCFTNPESVAKYYMEELRHQKQECIKLLMLNSKSKLIGEKTISKGTVNASLITPRELFIEALQKEAVSIILLHNHPSGDPTPSEADLNITNRIFDAGNLIGIELLDHIIIGEHCFSSISRLGLLGKKG